ncbi:uncharacterized protein PFLUO_LOCUS3199 [Penicillium psychrofluorescens]|uniref:uncharacterized protein n=1 Tax=Penicillium psychrofluorescens TaxID=3158075 RepID=UPI003CCDAA65
MSRAGIWLKILGAGIIVSVGGPLFVQSIRPTDEELVKRYNPDLQKRSAEQGEQRAQDFENYVNKLKEWSKSDRSIWFAAKDQQESKQAAMDTQRAKASEDARIQRDEMRKELLGKK